MRRLIPLFVLLAPLPALANNPPAPQTFLGLLLLLPLASLVTWLSGGHRVLRPPGTKTPRWPIFVGALAVLAAGTHEGMGLLVGTAFALYVLVRGVRLVRIGLRPGALPESRFPRAGPRRLVGAGAFLVAASLLVGGSGPAFLGWWVYEQPAERLAREVGAWQLARGAGRFEPGSAADPGTLAFDGASFAAPAYFEARLDVAPGARSFVLRVRPRRFPFFPYNLLVTLPSLRVDETGKIRAVRVHRPQDCPPDAPVVGEVAAEEIERARARQAALAQP